MFVTSLRVVACGYCLATAATAFAQSGSYFSNYSPYTNYSADPYDVPSSPVVGPSVSSPTMWQTDPFGVGYNLLGGYRTINYGARQPIGHEIIPTRADGNGYVYRPVYEASPGYHYTRGGALIVEFPQQHPTRADTPFPTLPPEQPMMMPPSSYTELPAPYAAPLPSPYVPQPMRSGPREF